GAVPLDGVYDIPRAIGGARPARRSLFYNAFATPAENAIDGAWEGASPVSFADPDDPPLLIVTQARSPVRIAGSAALIAALGEAGGEVLAVPYDHSTINRAVGSADDPAGETEAIMGFIDGVLGALKPPRAAILDRPKRRLKLGRRQRRARVRFRFEAKGAEARGFECRLDDGTFRRCSSPKRYRVRPGRHRFRVRAIAATGERGPVKRVKFRVVDRRRQVARGSPVRSTPTSDHSETTAQTPSNSRKPSWPSIAARIARTAEPIRFIVR
ncbi:MAG TPA: hypothetical protein VFH44_01985, partial [Solirubrobacterales bacterium]|nr:hypothetical protein [Solirubrobacterales bacterium]